jgi:glycosyltransferase involved in cell wall biosynthesis
MNILHIMDYAAPYKGNFIPSIENLEKHLILSGSKLIYMFPADTVNFGWIKQLEKEGKRILFIDRTFYSKQIKWKNLKCLLQIIKDEHISIIHTNFVAHNYTLFILKNFFNRKVKIIGQFQNHYILPDNLYRNLKIFVTKNTFNKIIGVSDSVEKSLVDLKIPKERVTSIHNSLVSERLMNYNRITLRESVDQKVVLMFGWPYYRKGVDLAIEVIKQLNVEGRDVLLAISLPGGKEIIEMEIQKKLGEIPTWVRLLNAREDVATYYNEADVFISPSREEGYTFAVLEAAYCDCMIIVSEIGGNPQDIPLIGKFENENSDKLKEVIIEMLEKTPEEKGAINKIQREYVLNKYDIDKWSERIINIYSTI